MYSNFGLNVQAIFGVRAHPIPTELTALVVESGLLRQGPRASKMFFLALALLHDGKLAL